MNINKLNFIYSERCQISTHNSNFLIITDILRSTNWKAYMKIRKYGAIDIGSNAVRLLIISVYDPEDNNKKTRFKKSSLIRVPIRLGADVFIHGKILKNKEKKLLDTMKAFALIIESYGLHRYMACATSAMRSANNGQRIIEKIKSHSGIDIQLIDGATEATYIAATDLHDFIDNDKNYLYVDVGGGSTEFTLYSQGKVITSKSFKIGTVRLLHNLVDDTIWKEAEIWIKKNTRKMKDVSLIGSGGNINNIFKSSRKKYGKPLSKDYLKKYDVLLNSMSYEDRIIELNLKEDRADVIVPATKIFLNAMTWARSRRIYVPKIGLADGMIMTMYNEDK